MRLTCRRRTYIVAVCVLGTAIASAGTAFGIIRATAEGQPADGSPLQLAPRRGGLPVVAGAPQGVVTALAARLPLVRNAKVVTVTIPGEDANPASEALVLQYELEVPDFDAPAIGQAAWQGNLFAGAVADEYALRGFGQIQGVRASLVTPDGQVQAIGGGIGSVGRDQVFDDIPVGIGRTVARWAPLFGLRSARVSFVHGLQAAVAITARSDYPKRDVAHLLQRGGVAALLRRPANNFEGAYLEVDNAAGSPVYVAAFAPRNGAGLFWVSPDLGLGSGGQPELPQSG